MRCRSTKEAGELVSQILGEHDHRLDHAAVAMVRSAWWEMVPECRLGEMRGQVTRPSRWMRPDHLLLNEVSGEIPWR